MIFRCLYVSIALICATIPLVVMGGEPPGKQGYRTIEELFSAYKKATEDRDWESLFLLGTRELQDSEIVMLVVSAATSNDETLKGLVEKHGANWKQFNHAWTEADNQRLRRDFQALVASFGKEVRNKPELFVAVRNYIEKSGDPAASHVHELKKLVRHGATAVGKSVERRTCVERYYDADGKQIGQFPRTFSTSKQLWFRQIDGYWYLATENEITPSSPKNKNR